jgi:hypothetical protein
MQLDASPGQEGDWNRVTMEMPCPICGGRVDCHMHAVEAFACCVQEPSEWRLSNGGWLHRIEGELNPSPRSSGVFARRTADRRGAEASSAGVRP